MPLIPSKGSSGSVSITVPPVAKQSRPVNVVFKNLTHAIGKKTVLNNVSGLVRPGEMLAIMGPSGSGKTTLLNALSGRTKCDSGKIMLNGKHLDKQLRRKICYVLQDDIFFKDLTVKQTLMYAAQLRLPENIPEKNKVDQVNHIIDVLELKECQNTIMGDVMQRGVSGGEKKRANIACELLTNPSVMLLDEPTSGLDSSTAFSLLQTLKRYAKTESKSLIVTIHQPSSAMFYMFDKLLLLCNGQPAYFGGVSDVVDFFRKIDMHITPHYNPADFIMEQVKKGPEILRQIIYASLEERKELTYPEEINENYSDGIIEGYSSDNQSKTGQTYFCPEWKDMNEDANDNIPNIKNSSNGNISCKQVEVNVMLDRQDNVSRVFSKIAKREYDSGRSSWSELTECSSLNSSTTNGEAVTDPKWPTSFYTQFKTLMRRNMMNSKARMLSKLNFVLAGVLAIVSGLIWLNVERTEDRLEDIMGYMFFGMTYWMLFAHYGALTAFQPEREVINKERASGAYRLSAYYLAKMVGELPLIIIMPSVYHFISYLMLGFNNPVTCFSIWGVLVLTTLVAQSVGLFIGIVSKDQDRAITISALFTICAMLFGGFYSSRMPDWVQWLQYLSMVYYAFNIMQIVEFSSGDPILCSPENSKFAACLQGNSTHIPVEDILNLKGSLHSLWINIFVLSALFVLFRFSGYLALRILRKPK
ncbi:ABC transporter G family member 14 [Nymphon striatum]|nr:ABC transporter G family member 14 [Nymphon striatum]